MTNSGASMLISVVPPPWASSAPSLLDQLGNIVAIVMLIVTATVAAYAAINREQLKTVRENNADLVQRVSILEGAETRLTSQLATMQAAADAQKASDAAKLLVAEQENEVLRSLVTNEAHLTSIEVALNDHHTQASVFWERTSDDMHAIRLALTEGNDSGN